MANGFNNPNLNPSTTIRRAGDMLSGTQLYRPAATLFGPSARDRLVWALNIAIRDLASAERRLPICYAELGKSNKVRIKILRTRSKSAAMRMINQVRKDARDGRKALEAAQAALDAFDHEKNISTAA